MKDEQLEKTLQELQEKVKTMFNSEDFKNYLNVMSRFTNYSFNNSLLIAMQCPQASFVASYRSWEANFERHVNKGEHGIKIVAPAPYKVERVQEKLDANGNKMIGSNGQPITEKIEQTIPAFKQIYVYDISQTSGKPLPEICHKLEGDVKGYEDFREALERVSPVPVYYENIPSEANGYYSPSENRIVIQEGMSPAMTCKTLLHEIPHSILHNPEADKSIAPDRNTKEVQAEAVSYTLCARYGIDSSEYSFGYLAGWSTGKELKELQSSMEIIRKTARDLISGIDKELAGMKMERTNELGYKLDDGYLLIDRVNDGYNCCLLNEKYEVKDESTIAGTIKRIDQAAEGYLKSMGHNTITKEGNYKTIMAERDIQKEQAMSLEHSYKR